MGHTMPLTAAAIHIPIVVDIGKDAVRTFALGVSFYNRVTKLQVYICRDDCSRSPHSRCRQHKDTITRYPLTTSKFTLLHCYYCRLHGKEDPGSLASTLLDCC